MQRLSKCTRRQELGREAEPNHSLPNKEKSELLRQPRGVGEERV